MPTNTYVALDKVTVSGTSTTSISFNSIVSTYTDLVIVACVGNTGSGANMLIRLNSDTGTNYSQTIISGTGSATGSNRYINQSAVYVIEREEMAFASNTYSTSIINLNNYANSATNKTILSRSGTPSAGAAGTDGTVGLWRSTAAITSITLLVNTGAFSNGSTFSLYGIASQAATAKATGGIITSDANYYYHTFVSSGTFTPTQSLSCDYLVVAGGGGGGSRFGGAGGAGGLRSTVQATGGGGSLETALSLSATAYTVTIGAGGSGSTSSLGNGTAGSNSVFASITSTGGGYGAGTVSQGIGGNGGSGGGGTGVYNDTAGQGIGGTASPSGQGFGGGTGGKLPDNVYYRAGGGGGGAGATGTTVVNASTFGIGGAGLQLTTWSSVTGTGVNNYFAGGGGGGIYGGTSSASGGAGGGGAGTFAATGSTGISGTANTGGGGGGGGGDASAGGAGGSGIVIVRYAK